eukprot:5718024-Prymnesium_polylepis.1
MDAPSRRPIRGPSAHAKLEVHDIVEETLVDVASDEEPRLLLRKLGIRLRCDGQNDRWRNLRGGARACAQSWACGRDHNRDSASKRLGCAPSCSVCCSSLSGW